MVATATARETRWDPGGADLMPGAWAAQEGGLASHGLSLQGVQNPILLKLGDVLQRVPGAMAGECTRHPSAEVAALVALKERGSVQTQPAASLWWADPPRVSTIQGPP